jgi:hypothetical protein
MNTNGWTRVLHFGDQRAPHECSSLERELMALLRGAWKAANCVWSPWRMMARYDFEIHFVLVPRRYFHHRGGVGRFGHPSAVSQNWTVGSECGLRSMPATPPDAKHNG